MQNKNKNNCKMYVKNESFNSQTDMCTNSAFVASKCIKKENDEWVVDSGASYHLTNKPKNFITATIKRANDYIYTANNSKIPIVFTGKIAINVKTQNGNTAKIILMKVKYAPKVSKNLISESDLISQGAHIFESPEESYIKIANIYLSLQKFTSCNRLYFLQHEKRCLFSSTSGTQNWHQRLSHEGAESLKILQNKMP